MSVTAAAVAKKAAVMLLKDKRTWKAIGLIISIAVAIALLPVMLLVAMGNKFSAEKSIDYSEYVQSLSAEQQAQLSQMESDGKAVEKELSALGVKEQTVKAQVIYLTYFENVQKKENFFNTYCQLFKNSQDDKTLILALNMVYSLNIDYEEFMRSYAMISNVNINKYRFLNLKVKNNIDLARWAENAHETAWGYVPHTFGNVLSAKEYKSLKEKYPMR